MPDSPSAVPQTAQPAQAGGAGGTTAPPETRLVLVRHGHARAVDAGVVGGEAGCSGLSDLGRRQAAALRDRFAALGFRPDAVVSSTLPRAVETAAIVAPGLGFGPAEVARHEDLVERRPGAADGLTWDEVVRRWGAADALRQPDVPLAPGGESPRQFRRRVEEVVARLARDHAGTTVVVVCHAGVILGASLALLGLGSRWFSHDLANASITEWVCAADGPWLLHRFNDAAHLEPVGPHQLP